MTHKKFQLSEIVPDVSCKYGAPMGRYNVGEQPSFKRIYERKVSLVDGYDRGGAYWGLPDNLRVRYTKDLSYVEFFRADHFFPRTINKYEYAKTI